MWVICIADATARDRRRCQTLTPQSLETRRGVALIGGVSVARLSQVRRHGPPLPSYGEWTGSGFPRLSDRPGPCLMDGREFPRSC